MANTIKRMRLKESYNRRSRNTDNTNDMKVDDSIGAKLLNLKNSQKVYMNKINWKTCLSIKTGLLIQDLISNCGCSLEKMPIIISTIIQMLFGVIDQACSKAIVKCSKTYARAADRAAILVKERNSNRLKIRNTVDSVLDAYLIMDATNKGNKSLVAKLFNYVCQDGIVRLGAFTVDNTGKIQAFDLILNCDFYN